MQSAKLHILSISCLLGAGLFSSSCTPFFKGRETNSAAIIGGKEIIHPRPQKKAAVQPNKPPKTAVAKPPVAPAIEPAAAVSMASVSHQPSVPEPDLTPAPPERMPEVKMVTPRPPQRPSPSFATVPAISVHRPAPKPEKIQIKPEPQRMVPKQSRPPEPSLTMTKETKPIEKMAKSSVPKPTPMEPEVLGPIVIADDRANRIVNANGRNVDIRCSNGVIVISGGCNKLTLSGDRNQVQCDSANEVELTGHVNTIVVGLVGTGTISGDRNTLSWGAGVRSGDPRLEATGLDNVLERLE